MVGMPPSSEHESRNPRTLAIKSTEQFLHSTALLFHLFGYRKLEEPSEATLQHWRDLVTGSAGDWMKVVKWKLTAFFNSHSGLPLPPNPPWRHSAAKDDPKMLLGGKHGRWQRLFLKHATADEVHEFLTSVRIGLKKAAPRPTSEQLKAAERAHVMKMTEEDHTKPVVMPQREGKRQQQAPPLIWGQGEVRASVRLVSWAEEELEMPEGIPTLVDRDTMKRQLARTVNELLQPHEYTMKDRMHYFFPSTSANYIRSRQEGGAVSAILEDADLMHGLRQPGGPLRVERESAREEESARNTTDAWLSEQTTVSDLHLQRAWQQLWARLGSKALNEPNLVEPVGLAEALKVRVITKGPPFRQTFLRPLWRKLHKVLRDHPVFSLLGQTVSEEYIADRVGHTLLPDQVYLSGDYEAATDNLQSWVSETIATEIAGVWGLSKAESKLLLEGLTRHEYEGGLQQQRGQLMGSVVSFPILCIANAAMSRWAMEVAERRKISLKDAALMINGDDVALRSHRRVYPVWQKITAFGGLIESLGKTYVSREFLEINSRTFRLADQPRRRDDPVTMTSRWIGLKLVRFVNLGLVLGLKRSQGRSGLADLDDPRTNMAARARELLASSPTRMHTTLMRLFIAANRKLLDSARVPWYIPTWLGGLGLPHGPWGQPSEKDLRTAAAILFNWREERPRQLGTERESWEMWHLASHRMPRAEVVREQGPLTQSYDKALRLQIINLLFDSEVSLEKLRSAARIGRTGKALRHNAKLWNPAYQTKRTGGRLPQPKSLESLQFQHRYFALPPFADWRMRFDAVEVGPLASRTVPSHLGGPKKASLD
jgi:hypothetical protein